MKNKKEVLMESIEKNQVPVGFTTHEVASIFSVSFTTVITWIRKGKIECYRTLGGHRRILPSEIERVSKLLSNNNKNKIVAPVTKAKPVTAIKSDTKPICKPVAKLKTPVSNKPIVKSKPKAPTEKLTSKSSKKTSIIKKPNKPINKI